MVTGSVVITGARSGRPNPERFAASCAAAASPNTWPSGMGNCAKSTAAAKKDSSEESMVYWLKSPPNLRLCLPREKPRLSTNCTRRCVALGDSNSSTEIANAGNLVAWSEWVYGATLATLRKDWKRNSFDNPLPKRCVSPITKVLSRIPTSKPAEGAKRPPTLKLC